MLRDEAVARIQQGLGFRTDLQDAIVSRLKEAQRDLERGKTLPRFLIVSEIFVMPSGTRSFTVPTNFLRVSSPLWYDAPGTGKRVLVEWRTFEESLSVYEEENGGYPLIAAFRRPDNVLIKPNPVPADIEFTWDYYAKGDVLDSNIENVWLNDDYLPELLIGEAGLRMALDTRDQEAQQTFMNMRNAAQKSLFYETILEEDGDVDYVMGANN